MRSWSFIVVTAAASALAALAAPATHGATLDTAITSLPTSVKQGGTVHLTALAVGGVTCSLTVRYGGGKTQGLGRKPIVVFGVAWTWRVPAAAAPGPAQAVLACGTAGRAHSSFTVERRLVPAQVVVAQSGVTQVPHEADGGADATYGVVLVNHSSTSDAIGVSVAVELLDRARRVVGTQTREIAAIPAGGTYYLGGVLTMADRAGVASVRPTVRIGGSKPKSIGAPVAGNVHVTQHGYDQGAYVDGQITNGSDGTLSSLAAVSTVFFDGAGHVIGGGTTFAPSALAPGASAGFELSTPVAASAIASVLASVEPRYGP